MKPSQLREVVELWLTLATHVKLWEREAPARLQHAFHIPHRTAGGTRKATDSPFGITRARPTTNRVTPIAPSAVVAKKVTDWSNWKTDGGVAGKGSVGPKPDCCGRRTANRVIMTPRMRPSCTTILWGSPSEAPAQEFERNCGDCYRRGSMAETL